MKPRTIELHNFKKWRKLNLELPENGVLLIKGKPNTGKTSLLQAIDSHLSQGKSDRLLNRESKTGYSEITWVASDGLEYLVRQDLTVDKDRFLVIMPDGSKKSRIKDVAELLHYNKFTVDEFIQFSYTADGRKKQRNALLNIMSNELQDQFFALEYEEEQTVERRAKYKKTLDAAQSLYDSLRAVSGERPSDKTSFQIQEDGKLQAVKHEEVKTIYHKYSELNTLFNTYTLVPISGEFVEDFERISHLYDEYSKERESLTQLYYATKAYEDNQLSVNKAASELKSANEIYQAEDLLVQQKREVKKAIISNYDFPFKNISVEDDGIWLIVEGERYELKWEQVSTSELYKAVAEIAIACNAGTDIVLMDRGESIGRKNIEWLDELARTNDVLMLITVVEMDSTEEEVIFEVVNKTK